MADRLRSIPLEGWAVSAEGGDSVSDSVQAPESPASGGVTTSCGPESDAPSECSANIVDAPSEITTDQQAVDVEEEEI